VLLIVESTFPVVTGEIAGVGGCVTEAVGVTALTGFASVMAFGLFCIVIYRYAPPTTRKTKIITITTIIAFDFPFAGGVAPAAGVVGGVAGVEPGLAGVDDVAVVSGGGVDALESAGLSSAGAGVLGCAGACVLGVSAGWSDDGGVCAASGFWSSGFWSIC